MLNELKIHLNVSILKNFKKIFLEKISLLTFSAMKTKFSSSPSFL